MIRLRCAYVTQVDKRDTSPACRVYVPISTLPDPDTIGQPHCWCERTQRRPFLLTPARALHRRKSKCLDHSQHRVFLCFFEIEGGQCESGHGIENVDLSIDARPPETVAGQPDRTTMPLCTASNRISVALPNQSTGCLLQIAGATPLFLCVSIALKSLVQARKRPLGGKPVAGFERGARDNSADPRRFRRRLLQANGELSERSSVCWGVTETEYVPRDSPRPRSMWLR